MSGVHRRGRRAREEVALKHYGPAERAVFEREATAIYEDVLAKGGLRTDDPRLDPDAAERAAIDLLLDLGLLLLDREVRRYVAVDPSTVQGRVVTPMGQEGATLLAESAGWAKAFGNLAQTWRRFPAPAAKEPFIELHGEAIHTFLASVVGDAESELMTAQPQTGRDAPALAIASKRDVLALERGVRMRILYQHSARRNIGTYEYVDTVTRLGAEVRTLDEFFNRLIVVDRQVAIIPGHQGLKVALAIREPSLVAYLIDMFERAWERGRPFTNRDRSMLRDIAVEQRAMTIRMLIEGHADPASAKRLGVSPRTYAAYVADLKEEYDAETRFQLGYRMGQLGISGREGTTQAVPPRDGPEKE